VDGVMGGLSSGELNFIDDNSILSFSGTISLDGGGFSSVRRRQFPVVDLQQYSGIAVTLQSTSTTTLDNNSDDDIKVPLGLHLQFHDTKDSFGYASALPYQLPKLKMKRYKSIYHYLHSIGVHELDFNVQTIVKLIGV